jgi:hypothetical protein
VSGTVINAATRDLFRRDQSDLDGTFSLHGVIPGTYTVVAIDNGWDLDWCDFSLSETRTLD